MLRKSWLDRIRYRIGRVSASEKHKVSQRREIYKRSEGSYRKSLVRRRISYVMKRKQATYCKLNPCSTMTSCASAASRPTAR